MRGIRGRNPELDCLSWRGDYYSKLRGMSSSRYDAAFLRRFSVMGKPTPEGTLRYRAWRATIKHTDEAIAGALDRQAEGEHDRERRVLLRELARTCRRGYVGKEAVHEAMPALVTTCALCDKKALYTIGTEGRCSDHRRDLPAWHYAVKPPNDHGVDAEVERAALAEDRRRARGQRVLAGRREKRTAGPHHGG